MMMKKQLILGVILFALFVIFLDTTQVEAARPFLADEEIGFVLQLLQRGTVPPSGPNGCTNIPAGSGKCHG
uniref:Transmembrane protein n=1 Tax=Noccaea caerulescens TaxID=107243 RepID=A0A1J3J6L3_NOCCA